MTKIEHRYWIETDSFVHSSHSTKPDATHTQNPKNPNLPRFEKFQMLKLSVVNLTLFILHNILIFL